MLYFFIVEGDGDMVVVYDSLTGQAKRFAEKLNMSCIDINQFVKDHDEEVLLVTRTFNFGEVPESTESFLQKHASKVKGVCVSGNRNWGKNYGAAGDKIAATYQIPLILKFEASGFDRDVHIVKQWIKNQESKGDESHVNV